MSGYRHFSSRRTGMHKRRDLQKSAVPAISSIEVKSVCPHCKKVKSVERYVPEIDEDTGVSTKTHTFESMGAKYSEKHKSRYWHCRHCNYTFLIDDPYKSGYGIIDESEVG